MPLNSFCFAGTCPLLWRVQGTVPTCLIQTKCTLFASSYFSHYCCSQDRHVCRHLGHPVPLRRPAVWRPVPAILPFVTSEFNGALDRPLGLPIVQYGRSQGSRIVCNVRSLQTCERSVCQYLRVNRLCCGGLFLPVLHFLHHCAVVIHAPERRQHLSSDFMFTCYFITLMMWLASAPREHSSQQRIV